MVFWLPRVKLNFLSWGVFNNSGPVTRKIRRGMFWDISFFPQQPHFYLHLAWIVSLNWRLLAWQWDVNGTGKQSGALRSTRCKQWSRRNTITGTDNEDGPKAVPTTSALAEHWWMCKCEKHSFSFTFWVKSIEKQNVIDWNHSVLLLLFLSLHPCQLFFLSLYLFWTFLLPLEPSVAQLSIYNSSSCFTFAFPSHFFWYFHEQLHNI